jgi:serine/threonine protein kinase
MGTVYLAFDRLLLRKVALKSLRLDGEASDDQEQHFVQEAQLTGQLDHPNIVPVHDLMTDGGEAPLELVMKYVDGEDYSVLIERLHASPTGTWLHDALQIFLKICDAVAFAHERGVVHCDLKPANVMVGKHGQVYVMDWGVALLHGTEDPPLAGTLGYMAPEQLLGERSAVDATTDVYGLGGILCFLVTGRPPRHGVGDIADWHTTPSIEDRRASLEVPPELCRIAERALSPAQADRFQSVDALKSEMEAFMAGGGWFETRHYLAGDVIIREGDVGAEAFIISSGACDVFKGDPEGTRQFIRSMGPGDTFGELSVLTRKPRSATVVAQTDVSLRLVTPDALDRELARNPVLASFMSAVTNRFCDLEARFEAGSSGS